MGSYAETLLAPGEVVVHRSRQHWLALILDSRVGHRAVGDRPHRHRHELPRAASTASIGQALLWIEVIAIVLGIIVVAWRWWNWRTQEYLITNRRLLKVTGVINKRSGDSSLEKINDAILEENLIGRMLDYGDLDILTAADIAIDRYRMLARAPRSSRRQMLQAKHALESGIALRRHRDQRALNGSPHRRRARWSHPGPGQASPSPMRAPAPLADPIDTAEEVTAALAPPRRAA